MRDRIIDASRAQFLAKIEKHLVNVEVLLSNPVGVAEHGDLMETIEKELEQVAHYEDLLHVIDNHF